MFVYPIIVDNLASIFVCTTMSLSWDYMTSPGLFQTAGTWLSSLFVVKLYSSFRPPLGPFVDHNSS